MRIGIIMFRHPPTRISPIMPEVARLLSEWGVKLGLIYPEEQVNDLARVRIEYDLYILKSGTDLALSMAGALHAAGAEILNPYPIAQMMRDKIVTTRILQAAGLPTPDTFVTASPRQLAPLLGAGPLVVKPYRGSQGRGVQVIRDVDQLNDVPTGQGPVFAQRCLKTQGPDRKIYCIGDQVFGVKRVWPPRTYEEKLGEPFTITSDLREIALRCGRAFGIDLFGLDVVISNGSPYVVDASSFPGFKGVRDAALRLADYLYVAGQRTMKGDPLLAMAEKGTSL